MKKLRIAVLLVTVISLTGLFLACDTGGSSTTPPAEVKKTPVASDFTVTGNDVVADGTPKVVTVTPKADASQGSPIIIKYNGNITAPSDVGVYEIKIDVPAYQDWNSVSDLLVGFLNIKDSGKGTPLPGHFTITGLPQTIVKGQDPNPAISVTPKDGQTTGARTIYYWLVNDSGEQVGNQIDALPKNTVGTYKVFFNVAADANWNAVTGFLAGTLNVREPDDPNAPLEVTPVTFDSFDFKVGGQAFISEAASLTVEYSGGDLPLVVTSKGTVTPPYPLTANPARISYLQGPVTVNAPKNVGTYSVNVVIAAIVDKPNNQAWNGLNINLTLIVVKRGPVASDYRITNTVQAEAGTFLPGQTASAVKHVIITRLPITHQDPNNASNTIIDYDGVSSNGPISIYYNGTADDGTVVSIGPVTGDVLSPGTFPAGNEFDDTHADYIAPPQKAGTYTVTFTVGAPPENTPEAANWKATGTAITDRLSAGTLEVKPLAPVRPTFTEHFWFDNDVLSVSANVKLINPGDTITFTPTTGTATVVGWWEDGKQGTANTDGTYTFKKTALGLHWVTLIVKANGGKVYSETVEIRVQTPN